MLTLFPRIRPNPPAPPPPQSSETIAGVVTETLGAASEVTRAAAATATQQPVSATTVAVSESAQAAPEDSASVSESQLLVAARAPISADGARQASASIDSQLISVFTEAFVASTSAAAADKAGAEPFVVEITCVPTSIAATDEPVAATEREGVLAESAPGPAPVDTSPLESVSVDSAPAPIQATDNVATTPVGEPSAEVLPAPNVVQSQFSEQPFSTERDASTVPAPEMQPGQLTMAATTIFDELDILHEVAEANAGAAMEAKQSIVEPIVALDAIIEATTEGNRDRAGQEAVSDASAGPQPHLDALAQEVLATPVDSAEHAPHAAEPLVTPSPVEQAESQAESAPIEANPAHEVASHPDSAVDPAELPSKAVPISQPVHLSPETSEAAPEVVAEGPTAILESVPEDSPSVVLPEAVESASPVVDESKVPQSVEKPASAPRAIALPRKPPRSKASFFELQRIPEPEAMEDSEEVEAYSSAAAQAHLNAIDDTFVAHAQLLVNGRERGRALDIGTGPGQIVIKLGARLTRWKFVGIDRSAAMIEKAREALADTPEVAGRIEFQIADGNSLDFPAGAFDLVICNSVLHHMAEPQNLVSEIARVVKPGGAILVRDLVRPPRFSYGSHIRKNAKHYQGEMKRLYVASVQAAYTEEELQKMLAASPLRDVRIFRHNKTHIGFERALARPQK